MTEINEFIKTLYKQGIGPTEISRRILDRFQVHIAPKSVSERIRAMKRRGDFYEEEELEGVDVLKEIEEEAGGLFKIGVLDIETTGLWADFGYVLCAVLKDIETNKYEIFRLDEMPSYRKVKNLENPESWRRIDRELLQKIREKYEEYDIIVHFNGRNFDIKFLNTRLIKNNLPILPDMKQLDIFQIAKCRLRLRSKSLDDLKEFLEVDDERRGHQWEYWQMAAARIKAGHDFVVEHCMKDVDRLAQVTRRMKAQINYIKK